MSKEKKTTKNMRENLMKVLMRNKIIPFKKSPLSKLYPRLSIIAGQVEKPISLFLSEMPGKTLSFLLTESDQPSSVSKNPYVTLTKSGGKKSLESRLVEKIKGSKTKLGLHEVFEKSIQECKGDYWLAMLTLHNLMKEITYAERTGKFAVVGWNKNGIPSKNGVLGDLGPILAKLKNLRPKGDPYFKDKMAIWYHTYGLLFMGSITSGIEADFLAEHENRWRIAWDLLFKMSFGKVGSKKDKFKMEMNDVASDFTYSINDILESKLYVPQDLTSMSKKQLQALEKTLKAKYVKFKNTLEFYSNVVNHPEIGKLSEFQMKIKQDNMQLIYDEVIRIKEEITKRVFEEIHNPSFD